MPRSLIPPARSRHNEGHRPQLVGRQGRVVTPDEDIRRIDYQATEYFAVGYVPQRVPKGVPQPHILPVVCFYGYYLLE